VRLQVSLAAHHPYLSKFLACFISPIDDGKSEVVLVRMCSDSNKPPSQQLHYKNSIDGLIRIIREEGLSRTMRGWQATVGRSVVMNASQLSW
jgi:dicarboxylate transporter 10